MQYFLKKGAKMSNEEFLKLSIEEKIDFILSIKDYKQQQDFLDYLKLKNKFEHIKVSGKVKSIKSNPKSILHVEEFSGTNELYIDIDLIADNPFQPRLYIEDKKLEELAKSIKDRGLLQPIVLNKSSENSYEIIAGHTRRDAVKLNGENKIKAIVFSGLEKNDPQYKTTMLSNALVENIHRNDLDPIETAISFTNSLNEGIYKNQAELAEAIGKQKIYVTKILSILKLENKILEDLRVNKSTKDVHALYFLQRIEDPTTQINMYFNFIAQKINREDIINFVKKEGRAERQVEVKKFIFKKNRIEIKSDFSKLSDDANQEIEKEMEKLIDKYI